MLKRSFLLAWLAVWACGGCAGRLGVADLVIVDARVWTGAGGEAAAVAVRGERIVAVGSDWQVRRWIGDETEVVEAGGRRVIPGITDSHIHIVGGGLQLGRLNLRDVTSRDEFVEKVAAAVQAMRDETRGSDRWMLGGRWSVESWDAPSPPRKEWIDAVTPETPVFLERMDGHQGLANSVALRRAGIDREGPADPAGGVIERDAKTGEPTGILKDAAMDLVTDLVPPPSEDDLYTALLLAMAHGNSLGITSMHDVSGREDLAAMFRAHREGALTVRIRKFLSVPNWIDVIDVVKGFEVNDAWLCVGGFKGYMDGSLGSRTAYMYRPYADSGAPNNYPSGILSEMASPPKELRYMMEQADAAGLQCAVHAIGDEANHILLDAYAAVARKNGPRDRRHRIEHAQHLFPEDVPRFAELGVVASMQPLHKADDGRYAEGALGKGRLAGSYAFRSLMDSGALVAFGSDWPVVSCDPFKGMAAAVTAQTLDGKIWIREESITIEEALQAYTVNPAMAGHGESQLGTIEVGKLADMVILSQDILHVNPERIADTQAVMTIVGGKIVFDRLRGDEPDTGPKNQIFLQMPRRESHIVSSPDY
ncbi:MAG: amidohydrolase family protein [Phycisphaerae bacterium]